MIIGFSGSMGSGKTTAIEALKFLTQDTKHKIHLVKFAQPLYDMQEYIYRRIDSVYTRQPDFEKDRKLLQWLGTDWGRGMREDLWVAIWKAEVKAKLAQGYLVVCDDVRFDNEAMAIILMDGVVVKINADNITDRAVATNGIAAHSSEMGIDPNLVTYSINNNRTKSEYQDNLKFLFNKILDLNTEAK